MPFRRNIFQTIVSVKQIAVIKFMKFYAYCSIYTFGYTIVNCQYKMYSRLILTVGLYRARPRTRFAALV